VFLSSIVYKSTNVLFMICFGACDKAEIRGFSTQSVIAIPIVLIRSSIVVEQSGDKGILNTISDSFTYSFNKF